MSLISLGCISKTIHNNWARFLSYFLMLAALQVTSVYAVQFENKEAFSAVKNATNELLGQLIDNREIYLKDKSIFYADIEVLLSPVVDFDRIARRIMAKHYKKANVEQRERFVHIFKKSLMQLYAMGLLEYDNQKIVVHDNVKSKSNKKQKVNVDIYSASGDKYPISYSMYLNPEGTWMMENLIVNGINIGLTYRNQFARLMKENKDDIDLVITNWSFEVNNDE